MDFCNFYSAFFHDKFKGYMVRERSGTPDLNISYSSLKLVATSIFFLCYEPNQVISRAHSFSVLLRMHMSLAVLCEIVRQLEQTVFVSFTFFESNLPLQGRGESAAQAKI